MTRLLNWSSAVTFTLTGVPAVAAAGAVTEKCVVVVVLTVIVPDVPVMVLVTVSVAVTVLAPAVFNVTGKLPVPLTSVALAGRTASASLLVKCTVPV